MTAPQWVGGRRWRLESGTQIVNGTIGEGEGWCACFKCCESCQSEFRSSLKFPLSGGEHVFMCPPGRRVHLCVERGGVMAQTTQQALRMCMYVPVWVVWSHISSSGPVIIPNCVWWGLRQSHWNRRQSGLLPKSAESYPVYSAWVKEEQRETFKGTGIKLDKWMDKKAKEQGRCDQVPWLGQQHLQWCWWSELVLFR